MVWSVNPSALLRIGKPFTPLSRFGWAMPFSEIIALVIYTTFPAIFPFLIGHVATATLPLPKVKLSRKIHITNFGNHFKTASKGIVQGKKEAVISFAKLDCAKEVCPPKL